MVKHRLIELRSGKVVRPGIDEPSGIIVKGEYGDNILVVKVPGHKYWFQGGPGNRYAYARQEMRVYRLLDGDIHELLVDY